MRETKVVYVNSIQEIFEAMNTPTDTQLKKALAKTLPEEVKFSGESGEEVALRWKHKMFNSEVLAARISALEEAANMIRREIESCGCNGIDRTGCDSCNAKHSSMTDILSLATNEKDSPKTRDEIEPKTKAQNEKGQQ
jgi:hypothetical protein